MNARSFALFVYLHARSIRTPVVFKIDDTREIAAYVPGRFLFKVDIFYRALLCQKYLSACIIFT